MEFSFTAEVNAPKKAVWAYYADIQKWYVWERDLKNITLDKGFKAGSRGIMELEGMPPMEYLLTAVTEEKEFWDRTATPFGELYFGHEISEGKGNSVCIKHIVRLESSGFTEEKLRFLQQVFADVPDSVLLLKNTVEAHA